MFDNVGDVHLRAFNPRRNQRFIKDSACGSNEWMAGDVFLISRLLTNQHDSRVLRTLTEYGLSAFLP
jgi:hypothetical protein